MKIGIATEETWHFMHDIFAELNKHHEVSIFKRPITKWPFFVERRNRTLFKYEMSQFLNRNDVVFFEWASELLSTATQLPKTCGIITRLHRYEMYKWVDEIDWDKVDKVILVSNAKRNEFIEKFPDQAEKTIVINVAVALDKFTYKSHLYSGEIGTLCHLAPRKRIYELILNFYELCCLMPRTKNKTEFHLHIGGDHTPSQGDYFRAMKDLVKKLNLEKSVTFYGKISDPWNWYHNLDIFVSNSYSEGLQVAPMEAMASGCYCLSHHWAGAEEMLPLENLYITGSELNEKILDFDALSVAGKEEKKLFMRDLAISSFNVEENKRRVRMVIEEIGSSFKK